MKLVHQLSIVQQHYDTVVGLESLPVLEPEAHHVGRVASSLGLVSNLVLIFCLFRFPRLSLC